MNQEQLADLALRALHAIKPGLPVGTGMARPVVEWARDSTGASTLTITMRLKEPPA